MDFIIKKIVNMVLACEGTIISSMSVMFQCSLLQVIGNASVKHCSLLVGKYVNKVRPGRHQTEN